jgi:hypothetical protein
MVFTNFLSYRKNVVKHIKPLRKKINLLHTSDTIASKDTSLNTSEQKVWDANSQESVANSFDNSDLIITDHGEDTLSFDHNIDHETWEIVHMFLAKKGMGEYFESVLGGEMKPDVVKYILRRTAELLIWTYQYKNNRILENHSIIYWFQTLILSEYILVQPFASKYLSGYRQLSPSTCLNYLTDFTKAINWFIWFRENRETEYPIEGASAGGILTLCCKLKKSYKPSLRKQRLNKTLEHLVESGHFPAGGLIQLQEVMVEDIQWAKAISEHLARTCLQTYNKFLAVLIGAMYCESPQGRIGGKTEQ